MSGRFAGGVPVFSPGGLRPFRRGVQEARIDHQPSFNTLLCRHVITYDEPLFYQFSHEAGHGIFMNVHEFTQIGIGREAITMKSGKACNCAV